MLSFFRINDPYRLLFVLGLLVLFRLPLYLAEIPLLAPELQWRLIGEAMAGGNHLYLDIRDDIGPLSGFTYQLLYQLFGGVRWPYYVLSVLLVLVQAALFNQVLLRNKAYKENTYVPAFFYMVFMNLSFDFITLPPILFSITFILLAVNNIFRRIDNTVQDELFLYTGLYLGIAVLFFLPSFFFVFSTLLSLLLFTGSVPRRLILLLVGFGTVLSLAYTYYYWLDGLPQFHAQFVRSLWTISKDFLVAKSALFWISGAGLLALVTSIFMIFSRARFANYQAKFQQVMMLNLVVGFVVVAVSNTIAPFQLIVFVPPLAFFVSHYVLEIRRRFWAELIAATILVIVLAWEYLIFSVPSAINPAISFENYFVKESLLPPEYRGKKIWVAGQAIDYYAEASLGSPFLNWKLSREVFQSQEYYQGVEEVYLALEKFEPDVIVDLEGFMPEFLERAPAFAERYQLRPGSVFYERTP